jgi:hypothetical protein
MSIDSALKQNDSSRNALNFEERKNTRNDTIEKLTHNEDYSSSMTLYSRNYESKFANTKDSIENYKRQGASSIRERYRQ